MYGSVHAYGKWLAKPRPNIGSPLKAPVFANVTHVLFVELEDMAALLKVDVHHHWIEGDLGCCDGGISDIDYSLNKLEAV